MIKIKNILKFFVCFCNKTYSSDFHNSSGFKDFIENRLDMLFPEMFPDKSQFYNLEKYKTYKDLENFISDQLRKHSSMRSEWDNHMYEPNDFYMYAPND